MASEIHVTISLSRAAESSVSQQCFDYTAPLQLSSIPTSSLHTLAQAPLLLISRKACSENLARRQGKKPRQASCRSSANMRPF